MPKLIYFGSLVQRTPNGVALIRQLTRQAHGKSTLFCDLNLRPDAYTQESIKTCLDTCSILKLNDQELKKVTAHLDFSDDQLQDRISYMMRLHTISQVIVTMGPDGSLWQTDTETFFTKAAKPAGFIF